MTETLRSEVKVLWNSSGLALPRLHGSSLSKVFLSQTYNHETFLFILLALKACKKKNAHSAHLSPLVLKLTGKPQWWAFIVAVMTPVAQFGADQWQPAGPPRHRSQNWFKTWWTAAEHNRNGILICVVGTARAAWEISQTLIAVADPHLHDWNAQTNSDEICILQPRTLGWNVLSTRNTILWLWVESFGHVIKRDTNSKTWMTRLFLSPVYIEGKTQNVIFRAYDTDYRCWWWHSSFNWTTQKAAKKNSQMDFIVL